MEKNRDRDKDKNRSKERKANQLGPEIFLLELEPKPEALFGVAWYFPSTYSVGMSGLGYQLVWGLLEKDREVSVSRGFTDKEEPGCQTAELFGFTVSWELDLPNILSILNRHNIPALSGERSADHPLVFGGGPVLSANPEPFADIFDVILLGDAEVTVPILLDAWKGLRSCSSRHERLQKLAQFPGLYIPSLYHYELNADNTIKQVVPNQGRGHIPERVVKQVFQPPPDYLAHSLILSPDTAWGDLFLVEVARSCPQECRFCLASFLTRPFRAARVDTLMQAIDEGLKYTKNIGLLGPSVTEHPQFDQIAEALMSRQSAHISVASVRADSLNEKILTMLRQLGQRSVTIAIESGSERLRAIMKKNLTESEILHAVDLIDQSGMEGVKFYGIAGLPFEQEADLEETVALLKRLKKLHKRLKFVFGVSSFVPKAQTPFQWWGRDRKSKEKLEYLRKNMAPLGIEVRPESHNWSDIQALISRGDRRLTKVMLEAAKAGGKLGDWKRALKNAPSDFPGLDFYAFRKIDEQEILPWSHLVDETRTQFLEKHNQAAHSLSQSITR